jgi:hypothetical protein
MIKALTMRLICVSARPFSPSTSSQANAQIFQYGLIPPTSR